MSVLGIDLGTSGCKAAAYASEGRQLAVAYREYPLLRPAPGEVELEVGRVLDAIETVIREVACSTAEDPVTALCFSSMGEAFVPVTRNRRVLGTSIVASLDLRGGEELEEMAERVGREAFYDINPNRLAATYSLPKLLWLKKRQPQLYAAADLFLLWGDFAAFMLGGDPCTSYALANRTLLFDIRKETWSEALLEASGIEGAKLPRPVPSGTIAGHVHPAKADALGLPARVAIVVGGHDQCCNALGAGMISAGQAVCGLGTFECITPVYAGLPDFGVLRDEGLNIEHHVLPGRYVSFLYNQAGSLVRWFRDTFAAADHRLLSLGTDLYAQLDAEMPAGPTGLLTLPYFEPTGAPEFEAHRSGVVAGLKTTTTRGEILRSILEGETFYFVRSLGALRRLGIQPREFVATGGGARSDAWLQIKADILGTPFARLAVTECGTLGAAILAGVATGVYGSPEEAVAAAVTRDRVFEPDARRHGLYREQFTRYEALLASLPVHLEPSSKDML